ncbi:MAG: hypothetical protein A3H49_04300 [Nitrospirae bacterium RIFCSPLOWO2_02_FULL_62_14]|nr:MAG: hypothetical protein A3H49_04300 [Nitrospirae bacterium RIFCSPLOWO2_02_FULL_62_14]OGW68837.1 MAG: hypothetical protein A3A88_10310 [Nitrospirae bacterium RIFCSPLOWO2_01_FULL_62_17]
MGEFGVSLHAQPLLTKDEAAFYNLLKLTVQDYYLVLAQVPVWCLVDVQSKDPKARASFLDRIALRRVDFVLIHPGTLATFKIIELDDPAVPSAQKEGRNKLVDGVFKEAGIALVRLQNPGSYTATTLAAALGLEG